MIRLIASDIDGTLVRDGENTLDPRICDQILRLREKGFQFVAASGRQWHSIERIFLRPGDFSFWTSRSLPFSRRS